MGWCYMSNDGLILDIKWWVDARYQMTGWCYMSNDGLMLDIKWWVDVRYQMMDWW